VPEVELIEGVLTTRDGYWRVEAIRYGSSSWYRVRHATTVVAEKVSIGTVQRILGPAFADLIDDTGGGIGAA
jgi:hypothetical protein